MAQTGPSPLTLLLPVKPGKFEELKIEYGLALPFLEHSIPQVGTIHYMRTLFLDRSSPNLQVEKNYNPDTIVVAVITEYDGEFGAYVAAFAEKLSFFFNNLLKFIVGSEVLGNPPDVKKNPQAFIDFFAANNATAANKPAMWCAYPYTVQQILHAQVPPATAWPDPATPTDAAQA